jgi:hypothetical protein
MGPVIGVGGVFTAGMNFQYGGENQFMDHINPNGSSFLIFSDQNDYYDCGIAYDAGIYRTVGTSFELGALYDGFGVSTKAALLDSIMHFFGIPTGIEEEPGATGLNAIVGFRAYPNPSFGRILIKFQISNINPPRSMADQMNDQVQVSLNIYDAVGRLVKSFNHLTIQPFNQITWSGTDEIGRDVPAAIYFVQLVVDPVGEANGEKWTEKVILLR